MKKTTLCFLIATGAFASTNQVLSQAPNSMDILSEAIDKIEFINSLNGANPKAESHKTTSKNRAITAKVNKYTFGNSPKVYSDSTVYINQAGRYSELGPVRFEYYLRHYSTVRIDPLLYVHFAANSLTRYVDQGTGNYQNYDTSSYVYNANGYLKDLFLWKYSENFYYKAHYFYDASDRLIAYIMERYSTSGTKIDSFFSAYRYGPNYVVNYWDGGTGDSAILDANNRVIYLYRNGRVEECTYDANGYLATYKKSRFGVIEFEYILTYEPDFKQYAYHYKENYTNFSNFQTKRVLLGQNGILDSVYFEYYNSNGVYLNSTLFTSVTTDSFGNITLTEAYDSQGRFLESYRYYYEDVITGLSDIRRPFSDFKVYPNPGTQSDIMISTGENFSSVTISSISGQKILHTSFRPRNVMRLDLSTLSAGSYLIGIRSDDGRESSQVFTKM